jgi:type II secretory pathway pseudopilin PulG
MELLVVMLIIAILAVIAVPDYLIFLQNAQQASAKQNVKSAVNAAESVAATTSGNTYYYAGGTSLTGADLRIISPGVASAVKATALNSGKGYCIESADAGFTYSYIGGTVTRGTVGVIQTGTCLADAGTGAS